MSISKRLIDLAKANLNALLEKAAGDGPLAELSDEELEAELSRRRQRRLQENEERRDREAAERAARQRAAERAAAQKNARESSASTASSSSSARSAPKPPPRQQARRPPPQSPAPPGSERRLRELYASLEVPYGAGFDEVKKSFRRLMRKYHPDLHVANPAMHKTATQLTMSLTQAYNELEQHLTSGRRR